MTYVFYFMLKVLGIVGIFHKHNEILIILKIVVQLNDVLVFHQVLDETLLLSLSELVLIEQHFLLNDFLDDLLNNIEKVDKILEKFKSYLITPFTNALDQGHNRGGHFHGVNLVNILVLS